MAKPKELPRPPMRIIYPRGETKKEFWEVVSLPFWLKHRVISPEQDTLVSNQEILEEVDRKGVKGKDPGYELKWINGLYYFQASHTAWFWIWANKEQRNLELEQMAIWKEKTWPGTKTRPKWREG